MYTMGTLLLHGSEAQKQRYLPGIAEGKLRLQAFGVTEPTSGTDTLSLVTSARRKGDRYIVSGQKVWTSRAEHSGLMLLLARTTPKDEVTKKGEGLSVFIVDLREAVGRGVTIKRSGEPKSELQSRLRISYAVFCLKKKPHTYLLISETHNKRTECCKSSQYL